METQITRFNWNCLESLTSGPHYLLYLTPGKSAEIHIHKQSGELVDVKVFSIGSAALYDLNIFYFSAPVKDITATHIIFDVTAPFNLKRKDQLTKKIDIKQFVRMNAELSVARSKELNQKGLVDLAPLLDHYHNRGIRKLYDSCH